MTGEEFKSFKNSIAYQAVRFQKGKIDGKELITALRAALGKDTFKEMSELVEEAEREE